MINTPTIIGLTGHAGAGKDTVASIILDAYTGDGIAVAFADALRLEVCAAFDVYTHTLSCRQTKEKPLPDLALDHCNDERFVRRMTEHYASGLREGGIDGEVLDTAAPRSPRQIMQWWGTEYRRHGAPGYWLDKMRERLARNTTAHGVGLIVITDVRFADEAALVRSLGGRLAQIVRPGTGGGAGRHESETAGSEFAPDAAVDNSGTVQDLRGEVIAQLHELFPGRVAYEDA